MLLTVIPVLQLFSKRSRGLKVNCRSVILSRLTPLFLHHREDRFFLSHVITVDDRRCVGLHVQLPTSRAARVVARVTWADGEDSSTVGGS